MTENDILIEGILKKAPTSGGSRLSMQMLMKTRYFKLRGDMVLEYWDMDIPRNKKGEIDMKDLSADLEIAKKGKLQVEDKSGMVKLFCEASTIELAIQWASAINESSNVTPLLVRQKIMQFKPVLQRHLDNFQRLLSSAAPISLDADYLKLKGALEKSSLPLEQFAEIFHDHFMSNLVVTISAQIFEDGMLRDAIRENMTNCRVSIIPGNPPWDIASPWFRSSFLNDGTLLIEFNLLNEALNHLENIGRDLPIKLTVNTLPYQVYLKVVEFAPVLTGHLDGIQRVLELPVAPRLHADFNALKLLPIIRSRPTLFAEFIHGVCMLGLLEQLTSLVSVDPSIKTLIRNVFTANIIQIRAADYAVDDATSVRRPSLLLESSNPLSLIQEGGETSVSRRSYLTRNVPQMSKCSFTADGVLVITIHHTATSSRVKASQIGSDIPSVLTIGSGVSYSVNQKIMQFKPVLQRHLDNFQRLLSSAAPISLDADYLKLKGALEKSSLPLEQFAEIFYDQIVSNLVKNLSDLGMDDPNLVRTMEKMLHAKKIAINCNDSESNITWEETSCHRCSFTDGVLLVEFKSADYFLSNLFEIGYDIPGRLLHGAMALE